MGDDPTEDLLKEIASKHGVALDREDPILIVQTMHARLLAESRSAQQAMLEDYRTTLEALLDRWGAETKAKAERIVTASLTASTETMKAQMAVTHHGRGQRHPERSHQCAGTDRDEDTPRPPRLGT